MRNSILALAKVAEKGANYKERAGLFSGTTWNNAKFHLRDEF